MTWDAIFDRLALIGGANSTTLEQVPKAKKRFVALGCVLIATSFMAAVSMTFAMADGVHVPLLVAPFIGLLWGGVIFVIDRLFVVTMSSSQSLGQLLLMAAPRIIAAAVIGVVVSMPLVLRVFSSEINEQMYKDQLLASHANVALVDNSAPKAEQAQLQAQIHADQLILAGHLPNRVTSPELQDAQGRIATLSAKASADYQTEKNALEAWQCELYGAGTKCHDASYRKGAGPLAAAKHDEYVHAVSIYQQDERELRAARQAAGVAHSAVATQETTDLEAAQAKARAEMPGLENRLAEVNRKIGDLAASGNSVVSNSNGLLAQLRALSELDRSSFMLKMGHLVLAFLFFLIEIMPVLAKILMSYGPPDAYAIVDKADDDEIVDRRRAERVERRKILEGASQTRIDIEADMRKHELSLGLLANDIVKSKMEEILRDALEEWKRQATGALAAASMQTITPTLTSGTIPTPTPHFAGTPTTAPPAPAPVSTPPTVTSTNTVLVLPDAAEL
ncbi:MAG TPA: DUF4407 domain-containing protein [Mycobacteriales bacterium]|nr:DUF4407 domain-containing protein [Mycobacteriales bacterium]